MKIKIRLKTKIENENVLLWAMFIPICALSVQLFLYKITGNMDGNAAIHQAAMVVSAIPMICSMFIWARTHRGIRTSLTAYIIAGLAYALQFAFYPENREYLQDYIFKLFFMCIPAFINSSLIKDKEKEEEVLKKASWIMLAVGLVHALFVFWKKAFTGYTMSYGYYLILPACFFSYSYFKNKKRGCLFSAILAAALIMILGSRGPLVAWAIYFTLLILFSQVSRIKKASIIVIISAVVALKTYIINLLQNLLNVLGVHSRTLELLARGEIMNDTGRKPILNMSIDMIREHVFEGNGIGADMRVMGTYPHNIFVEVLLQYGIVFGSLLLLGLIFFIIKDFFRTDDKQLYLFYFCIGFVPTMVSGTYLQEMTFWIFVGYLAREKQDNHVKEYHKSGNQEKQKDCYTGRQYEKV